MGSRKLSTHVSSSARMEEWAALQLAFSKAAKKHRLFSVCLTTAYQAQTPRPTNTNPYAGWVAGEAGV